MNERQNDRTNTADKLRDLMSTRGIVHEQSEVGEIVKDIISRIEYIKIKYRNVAPTPLSSTATNLESGEQYNYHASNPSTDS